MYWIPILVFVLLIKWKLIKIKASSSEVEL